MTLKHYIVYAIAGFVVLFLLLPDKTGEIPDAVLAGGIVAHLPDPASNNAVAAVEIDTKPYLYSFSGLGEGKSRGDIHSHAYVVDVNERFVRELPPVPGGKARLASTAAAAGGKIYVIGGYTVGQDDSEVSTPEVYVFDPVSESYSEAAPMPLAVDDAVALVYQERYIYLVSGWHDSGNVSNVQVFDTLENLWFEATPYPGPPVFGHAGGISGNRFVIADGVAVLATDEAGRRTFGASDEVYLGTIDTGDPAVIEWQQLPPHPGKPLYRMAAAGDATSNLVVFAGGSDNPYNYNGIGYDKVPSDPSASVFGFDIVLREWRLYGEKPYPSMDHRGLIGMGGRYYIIGGMIQNQEVTDAIGWFELEADNED